MPPVFQPYDQLLNFETGFGDVKDILKKSESLLESIYPKQFLSTVIFKRSVGEVKDTSDNETSPYSTGNQDFR